MTRVENSLNGRTCAPPILSLFIFLGCVAGGCGQPTTPEVQPAPPANSDWPAPAEWSVDESLTSEEYLRLGMPAADRDWSSIDMGQAKVVLAKLPGGNANLPRYQSPRSGAFFARITSAQNLELFQNRTLPLDARMPLALDYGDASNHVFKVYVAAFLKKAVRDSEMVELLGAQLRMAVVNVELMDELLPKLDQDDPTYQVRMQGFEQAKRGIASVVMGALQTFDERQSFRQSELKRLADYLRDTFPTLVPLLPQGARTETITRLKKMQDDPSRGDYRPALQELLSKLDSTAVAKPKDTEQRTASVEWKRYSTPDGVCSAEFPQPPKEDSQFAFGIESKRLLVYLEEPDILYMLTFSEISADFPAASDEERLNAIRENLPLVASQKGKKFQFVSEAKIVKGGFPGRDLVYSAGENHYFRTKVLLVGNRLYRMILVTQQKHKDDEDSNRFMDSFEIETGKAEVRP